MLTRIMCTATIVLMTCSAARAGSWRCPGGLRPYDHGRLVAFLKEDGQRRLGSGFIEESAVFDDQLLVPPPIIDESIELEIYVYPPSVNWTVFVTFEDTDGLLRSWLIASGEDWETDDLDVFRRDD